MVEALDLIGIPNEKVLSLSRFKDEETLSMLHRGEPLYMQTIGRNLLILELGASYGHFKAIGKFLASEYEYGLIFDDDARMVTDPSSLLSNLELEGPTCLSLCENLGEFLFLIVLRWNYSSFTSQVP